VSFVSKRNWKVTSRYVTVVVHVDLVEHVVADSKKFGPPAGC